LWDRVRELERREEKGVRREASRSGFGGLDMFGKLTTGRCDKLTAGTFSPGEEKNEKHKIQVAPWIKSSNTWLVASKRCGARDKDDWSSKTTKKCEKNLAQLAHKQNSVAIKRVTIAVFVCHVAHKPQDLAQ
jgi:hypothetical protein